MQYKTLSPELIKKELESLYEKLEELKAKNLNLDMSRGKPCREQLVLSDGMLSCLGGDECTLSAAVDLRNYGVVEGIPACRKLFAELLEVESDEVLVCGNSSLNIMYDTIVRALLFGVDAESTPWKDQGEIKFLCPVPGYDRHFRICETMGIKMISVAMTKDGPDMDEVERLVASDDKIKGIWCVPKYSNPEGITYSDETVRRFAALKPAASDFRIFWDNAYFVHEIYEDKADVLLNLLDELKKTGREDMAYIFASTSKISYPGAGVAVLASSKKNIAWATKHMFVQTIGHDKVNQGRHVKFFKNAEGVRAHMMRHAAIMRPKFDVVLSTLEKEFENGDIASWTHPLGGYFVSLDLLDGCAKRTVQMCAETGVKLTDAGATHPYGLDPRDRNIRIAPSYPSAEELAAAIEVLCVCAKITCLEKLL